MMAPVVDHVTTVVAAIANDLVNPRTACSTCNTGKGARPLVGC
jgi:hypothetical protein